MTAWEQHAHEQLAHAGHRAGGARAAVVGLLAGHDCLVTAQDIQARLLTKGTRPVGLASVYRALEALSTLRLVHRVDVEGTAFYERAEPSGDHHHHAICDRCGRLSPFESDALERVLHDLGERLGYDVQAHDVVLRGECPDCVKA